jgi:hypothetical protein
MVSLSLRQRTFYLLLQGPPSGVLSFESIRLLGGPEDKLEFSLRAKHNRRARFLPAKRQQLHYGLRISVLTSFGWNNII